MAFLGEIRMFAGSFAPSGWGKCDGSILSIQQYPELAEYLGSTYGGDHITTFGLPNLGANAPLHRSDVYAIGHTSSGPLGVAPLASSVLFLIALTTPPQSEDSIPFIGEVRTFSFGAVPRDWLACDGSVLNIKDYTALYSIIENQYGGSSDAGTFALPDLRGNTVAPVASTDPLGYVVMNYCIATTGTYPTSS